MTGYSDIARAYEAYDRLGSWDQVDSGLIYTCNAGWVDLGHMRTTNTRRTIGASNLWAQIDAEGPELLREVCTLASADLNIGYTIAKQWLNGCNSDPYYRFPDGQTGFEIIYRQDHENIPGRPGSGGRFIVKHGMTSRQKKSVALSIFMDVSRRFEWFQRVLSLNDFILTNSGHSEEDLVSNLLGFYIAIGELSKAEVIRLVHPTSRETAEHVWRVSGAVGDNKNRTWEPNIHDTGFNNDVAQICQDECLAQPKEFPAAFQSIQSVEEGSTYVRLSTMGNFFPLE